jgi:hypothetical protein
MKRVSLNFIFLILIISFVGSILFGSLLRYHYNGGTKFKNLQKVAVFFAEIPFNIKFILENKKIIFNPKLILKNKTIIVDVLIPISEQTYDDKKFFDKKLNSSRNELILISRHDGDLQRSIVEIRDLNTFEVLHSYLPDIQKIYEKTDLTKEEFKYLIRDIGLNKYYMWHPAITSEGELIFQSSSPLVKIDFNSKIIWVNDEDEFHHGINLDLNENIYVPSRKFPYSKKVASLVDNDDKSYEEDTINILNQEGKIIFSKSVSEILIENGLIHRIFSQDSFKSDPTHLNDIQPVLKDGPYFKKGDLFLSLRHFNMIILYRPETNKIIKIIEGGFLQQHDVDILDDKTISIYNNNVFLDYNGRLVVVSNNEILIYHFDTDSFSKKFEDTFKTLKINTKTDGLVNFLDDGSAIVEDNNNGRIFYLNNNGDVIWEFNNINKKKQIYSLFWARIISSEQANKIKQIIKKEKN